MNRRRFLGLTASDVTIVVVALFFFAVALSLVVPGAGAR